MSIAYCWMMCLEFWLKKKLGPGSAWGQGQRARLQDRLLGSGLAEICCEQNRWGWYFLSNFSICFLSSQVPVLDFCDDYGSGAVVVGEQQLAKPALLTSLRCDAQEGGSKLANQILKHTAHSSPTSRWSWDLGRDHSEKLQVSRNSLREKLS